MEYTQRCENGLLKHLRDHCVKRLHSKPYFSIHQLKYLPKVIIDLAEIEELAIEAFYVVDDRRLELQEYSLSLRVEDRVQPKEQYILSVTNKEQISEIDGSLLTILEHTYYEIKRGEVEEYVAALKNYFGFMLLNEPKILKEINHGKSVGVNHGIYYKLL